MDHDERPPFVDTHVHFHDLRQGELTYDWLLPASFREAQFGIGKYGAIRAERYWPDDFISEVRFHNVQGVVHVENALGIEDPVEETRWLQAQADRTGVPHGIVAQAHLGAPDVAEVLQRHLEFPATRGVRDRGHAGYAGDDGWERGFALLGEMNLVCCDSPPLEQAKEAAALAARHPDVTLCIDHAGFPKRRDPDYFREWCAAVERLAAVPSTVVKISGLGMRDHRWTVESIRPWVLTCIERFGVERSFFGTNWPVDRLFSSYGDVLDAYAEIIRDFSAAERRALFAGNARRVFRLE